jgi:hypothetical protein
MNGEWIWLQKDTAMIISKHHPDILLKGGLYFIFCNILQLYRSSCTLTHLAINEEKLPTAGKDSYATEYDAQEA